MNKKIVFIQIIVLVLILVSSSWYNYYSIVEIEPGHIFYNRGYPFPFTGVPVGKIYYPNLVLSYLTLNLFFYFILYIDNFFIKMYSEKEKDEWVIIDYCKNKIDAELIGAKLKSNGINFKILSDDVGGMYPFPFQPRFGTKLYVHKDDLLNAKSVIK